MFLLKTFQYAMVPHTLDSSVWNASLGKESLLSLKRLLVRLKLAGS